MVGMIASRRAGKTLLAIIVALSLPILLLSALYFKQSMEGVNVLDREITGVALVRQAYGPFLDEGHRVTDAQQVLISAHERKLGIPPSGSFPGFLSQARAMAQGSLPLGSGDAATLRAQKPFSSYLSEAGNASGLFLDSEPMSRHLADALVEELPKLVDDYERLTAKLAAPAAGGALAVNMADAHQTLGELRESATRLSDSLGNAQRFAAGHEEYRNHAQALQRISANIETTRQHLSQASLAGGLLTDDDRAQFAGALARARVDARSLMDDGLTLLDNRLRLRRTALFQEIFAIAAAGLACGLLALLLSSYMFRRMLVRLDELSNLNESAEFARRETDRINAEVASLNRDLSDKVQQLSAAQTEIVRKGRMEQLGQLTATIAHELRNPLGAVRTSAFLIEKKAANKGLDIELQLQRINTGIKRCDDIITQLLDFSRTRQISVSESDLDEWLARTVSDEAAKLPPQLIVECTLGLGGKHVSFDGSRLARAITNLMHNAAEAMTGQKPDGTSANITSPTLWISTFERDGEVVIRTRDNGPGIQPENLARVREPLFTTKNFGTGLGIPAVEQIAVQHGGRLEIESVLGEGACFDLVLPARSRSAAAARTA